MPSSTLIWGNLHTHTPLCNHATGEMEEYVKKAIELGFKVLGFSDHAPNDKLNDPFRMKDKDYQIYSSRFDELKEKYKDQITLFKGIEIEYDIREKNYVEKFNDLEYIILGQHYIVDDSLKGKSRSVFDIKEYHEFEIYIDTVIEAIKTRRYTILAHPDLFLMNNKEYTKEIDSLIKKLLECVEEYDIMLEINANGIRRKKSIGATYENYVYPDFHFFNIAKEYNVRYIISSDAHAVDCLYDTALDKAIEFAKILKLKNIINLKENL